MVVAANWGNKLWNLFKSWKSLAKEQGLPSLYTRAAGTSSRRDSNSILANLTVTHKIDFRYRGSASTRPAATETELSRGGCL